MFVKAVTAVEGELAALTPEGRTGGKGGGEGAGSDPESDPQSSAFRSHANSSLAEQLAPLARNSGVGGTHSVVAPP